MNTICKNKQQNSLAIKIIYKLLFNLSGNSHRFILLGPYKDRHETEVEEWQYREKRVLNVLLKVLNAKWKQLCKPLKCKLCVIVYRGSINNTSISMHIARSFNDIFLHTVKNCYSAHWFNIQITGNSKWLNFAY